MLAGIGELTLIDSNMTTLADLPSNFFLATADVGKAVSNPRRFVWTADACARLPCCLGPPPIFLRTSRRTCPGVTMHRPVKLSCT